MTTLELPARVSAAPLTSSLVDPLSSAASTDILVPFKVVLLYEDMPAARRGAVASCKLAQGLSPGTRIRQSAWRFDLLDIPRWQFAAMIEAAQADAVIVSSHSADLSPGVTAWLDAALADHVGLIVILLSGTQGDWTITIRHAPDFTGTPSRESPRLGKTFHGGSRLAPHPQIP